MTYCYLQDIIIIIENNRMMLCLIGIYKVKYCLMVYDIICIGEIFGIYFYDKILRECNNYLNDKFIIKGNKLYEYDYENNLDSIYVIGDFIKDITFINNNNKQYEEVDLIISDIRDNKVFFKGGLCLFTKEIRYMCTKVQDNKLTYDEQQCAEDFISILNTDEKHEFISNDVSEILLKYKNAIVNRTNMCIDNNRSYMTEYEKNMGIDGITPVVETVINNIKYILN